GDAGRRRGTGERDVRPRLRRLVPRPLAVVALGRGALARGAGRDGGAVDASLSAAAGSRVVLRAAGALRRRRRGGLPDRRARHARGGRAVNAATIETLPF